MQDGLITEMLSKLERLEQRLISKRNAFSSAELNFGEASKYDSFNEKYQVLQSKLKAKLAGSRGIDWELLKLELQNDLLLLTNSFDHWSKRLDAKFNKQK
ncbi:hypothetical protein [Phyllobacterium sp. P30BS-XVII]|uniref:hypothetical protein n=1 Tax=Phyllobacterium sp. P30BS-XVII TaxID=2587046 RepID=UPI000DE06A0F|nr:hypothetical protein [Phyllobacterium sp. P30BS-XVII]MBA8903122.1 hypothetical protein [Phyllobacterium sp. P30BS-XVII]